MKFKKKPIVIEAVQFDGINFKECKEFIGNENIDNTLNYPNIITLEGVMEISIHDWIIKGIKGEFYPCKPNIFNLTYEPIGLENE